MYVYIYTQTLLACPSLSWLILFYTGSSSNGPGLEQGPMQLSVRKNGLRSKQRCLGRNLGCKGPSTNITRILGFYKGNHDYGLGHVLLT